MAPLNGINISEANSNSATNVIGGFSFGSVATLAPQRSARRTPQAVSRSKQSSLPPSSSRRTRTRSRSVSQPRSAARPRTASAIPSSASRRNASKQATPQRFATPTVVGKRKRGSNDARLSYSEDDGEIDELTPNNNDYIVASVEKSRRVATTVSPIQEDEEVDDLMMDQETTIHMSSGKKGVTSSSPYALETPIPAVARAKARLSMGGLTERTSIASRIGNMSATIRTPIIRSNKRIQTREIDAVTPVNGVASQQQQDRSASVARLVSRLSHLSNEEPESDDELSPERPDTIISQVSQRTPARGPTPSTVLTEVERGTEQEDETSESAKKQRKPQRVVMDDEDVDELSPEASRIRPNVTPTVVEQEFNEDLDVPEEPREEENEEDDEWRDEEEPPIPTPRPVKKPPKAKPSKPARDVATTRDQPPKKRQKRDTAAFAIPTMRLKGGNKRFFPKGVSAVDAAKQYLFEIITRQMEKMSSRLEDIADPDVLRQQRRKLNVFLLFKDTLEDQFIELQDATDAGATYWNKAKAFKKSKRGLIHDLDVLREERADVALQTDEIRDRHKQNKDKHDGLQELSAHLFDIQAAVQNGRTKAQNEGRENEAPEVPIRMLTEEVARVVGASGGLLASVQYFNGVMEKAAGILEGRA